MVNIIYIVYIYYIYMCVDIREYDDPCLPSFTSQVACPMAPSFAAPFVADSGAQLGTALLLLAMAAIYGSAWQQAKALRLKESALPEAQGSGKKPRIGAFDSLRRGATG